MRSLKSGLFAIVLSGLLGTAAVVGCSANGGDSGIGTGALPTDPTVDPPAVLPPNTPDKGTPDSGSHDSGGKDAAPKKEAGVDAGPPPPVPGTPCTDVTVIGKKPCGACGHAEALCQADAAGVKTWTDYGACGSELAGGCTPGTVVQEACGNCGTLTKTCTQFCAFSATACAGQPVNNCKAGTVEYTTASCTQASTYKFRTCQAACTWSGYSATCAAPVNDVVLTIPTTVGAIGKQAISLSAAKVGPRLSAFGACPQASTPTPGNYALSYVELKNTSAKVATVTIYNSAGPSAVVVDTIRGAYANAIQPMDDASRKACNWGVDDQSSAAADLALTGDANFAILKAVPIPAGGSILVYTSAYYEVGNGFGDVAVGDIMLNVKVDALN